MHNARGDQDRLWVKTGTQIIDNSWKRLRATIPQSTIAEDSIIDSAVREFQWFYWNGEVDKWRAVGELFSSMRSS